MAFSAAATRPTTRTGQPTARSAPRTAMTTAPPVMSRFMLTIDSPGLIERPPVSKVMPLPTRTTVGVLRVALTGRVVEPDQPRRGGRGLPDRDDAAEALGGELLLVPDGDVQPGLVAGHLGPARPASSGLLRFDGTVASIRARQPAPPTASARSRTAACASASGRPASTTRLTGTCSGGRSSASGSRRSRASPRRRRPPGRRRRRGWRARWRRWTGPWWRGPGRRRPGGSRRPAARPRRPAAPSAAPRSAGRPAAPAAR